MIPNAFTPQEAKFLIEYRDLCDRHGMCLIVEAKGQMGLINIGDNRIWACTAGQMVNKQIEAMSALAALTLS